MSIAARTLVTFRRTASFVFLAGLAACTLPTEPPAVLDSTVLHQVEITVDAAHLNQLAFDLDNRVPSTIVYDGQEVAQAGIRQKGNAAIALEGKPSFSVRFDEFVDKTDIQGLNKILLNSSADDSTFLREKLGAEAHARAGLPAARIAHAKVTFNGVDKGIYVVVEGIDKDFLRLHFGETNDEGNLYEGPCCGDFALDATYRQDEMDLDDEKKDDRTRDDINALAELIASAPDTTLAAEVERRLDLDQFMKIYALEVLLLHWDGFAFTKNNYYMYNNPIDSRFVFFPHGMDQILADLSFDFSAQAVQSRLPQRIHEIPALDARYRAHLAALEATAWNPSAMQASIDQTVALLHKADSGAQTRVDLAQLDTKVTELRNVITVVDANLKQ